MGVDLGLGWVSIGGRLRSGDWGCSVDSETSEKEGAQREVERKGKRLKRKQKKDKIFFILLDSFFQI